MYRNLTQLLILAICVVLGFCPTVYAQLPEELPRFPEYTLIDRALDEGLWDEIGLEEKSEQVTKIRALSDAQRKELLERYVEPNEEDRRDLRGLMSRVRYKYEAKVKEVLGPQQCIRLQQIYWQNGGKGALLDPELAKVLELTKDQQDQLAVANAEFNTGSPAYNAKQARRTGPRSLEEIRKKSREDSENWDRRIKEILSTEQLAKFEEAKGKQFNRPTRKASAPRMLSSFPAPQMPLYFVRLPPVLKELGIPENAPQLEALRELRLAITAEMDFNNPDRILWVTPAHMKIKYDRALQKLLQPEQWTRLQQIVLQSRGFSDALGLPEVAQAVGLTPEQSEQAYEIQMAALKKSSELLRTLGRQDEERRKKSAELQAERDQKLKALLTPEQQEKLDKLLGKPFDVAQLRMPPAGTAPGNKPQEKK